jgi:hypothetical protein
MEYDLKLIINVNEINSIVPNYEVRKPSSQNIEVVLSESKAETLFYLLWNKFGDDWLIKCLEGEGYKMIEIEQPKKELKTSNSLDEVRAKKPQKTDFKLEPNEICEGWDYLINPGGSFGFYNKKAYLKAVEEWAKTNQ